MVNQGPKASCLPPVGVRACGGLVAQLWPRSGSWCVHWNPGFPVPKFMAVSQLLSLLGKSYRSGESKAEARDPIPIRESKSKTILHPGEITEISAAPHSLKDATQ